MKGLQSLIKVLRPSEKRLLEHYYSRRTNAEEKLRLKLFKLVDGGEVQSDNEAKVKLNGSGSASAYSHLKARLKNDILNILLTQDTSKRLAQANRAAELDCRKKVAQSHLLLLRGAQVEGMKILQVALRSAERYELLAERLQIHHLLREKFLGAGSSQELTRLNKEIADDLSKYGALLYVEEQSFILSSPEFGRKLQQASSESDNVKLIEELGALYKKHKLARIGFWYYMAASEYYTVKRNFDQVVAYGVKFLKLVEKNPAVRSKNNMAGVNQTLGSGYMELRQFEKAIDHLTRAQKLFPVAGFNRLQSLQLLVQSEVAVADHGSALRHIELALDHPRIKAREHLLPRWTFIKASVQFLNDQVEKSFKTLNADSDLLKRQDEWNIQFRLLEMMQLVEMKDEDWLDFKLDATRKFLTRYKELDTPRVRTAIDLIANLLRKELSFDKITEKNKEALRLSLAEGPGYEWNPSGAEIIRIDRWFDERLPRDQSNE